MSTPVGQSIDITITCRDRAGGLIDVTTLTVKTRAPNETVTAHVYGSDPELIRLSVGVYRLTMTPDADGDWYFVGSYAYTSGGETVSASTRSIPRTVDPTF